MRSRFKHLITGMVLAAFLLGFTGGNARAENRSKDSILEGAASDVGIVNYNLKSSSVERKSFPLTNTTLYQVKIIDSETGEITGTVVDENGSPKDLEAVRLAEQEAHDALYGRLQPDLYNSLEKIAADATVPVAIWLKSDSQAQDSQTSLVSPFEVRYQPAADEAGDAKLPLFDSGAAKPQESNEKNAADSNEALAARVAEIRSQQAEQHEAIKVFRQEVTDYLTPKMAVVQQPLLDTIQQMGFKPIYVSPVTPMVYFDLPKWAIQELSQHADIDSIYGPNDNRDYMDTAKTTQKADIVDSWFGFDGTGIDVAICEDSRIEFTNPYLNIGTTRVPGDTNVDDHATGTAGMVASQHTTYQGISQGVTLFSANGTDYSDANMAAAMDWAIITQSVDIMNNSWGGNELSGDLNEHDRHVDYLVRNFQDTIIVAAGNDGPTGYVGSPAKGYNVISVGNYQDQGTLTWDDDDMHASSSYLDPSTRCMKPELSAAGSSITSTTTSDPWTANVGSGTSYAAPMVSGAAAMLLERSGTLNAWPGLVKSVLMATALHNIEGDTRFSDIDGAGGVDMRAAFRVVDEGWFDVRNVSSTSFPYSISVYAYAGETVRAVTSWLSNPNASYTTNPLEADIELRVYNPTGSYVTGSTSSYNNFEIVEFTAATTGNYELRIDDFSFNGIEEQVTTAWWPGHRVLTSYTPQSLGTPPVSRDHYRFTRGAYWNVVGMRKPTSTGNYWLYLYENSAFSDPGDYNLLEDSRLSQDTAVEYVVIDGNHAPSGDYYAEVKTISGTGNYPIEFSPYSARMYDGTYGPYTMTTSQVARVFDSFLSSSSSKYFGLKVTSGDADLGMRLHDSASGTLLYQGRSSAVDRADANGAGENEFMDYLASTPDWYGLVVYNSGATSTTTFYLYSDTTEPTGSMSINSGAAATSSTSVTLTLSAADSQTGVAEMRFANYGVPYSTWEPYSTSKSWTLPAGDGNKNVYVQFKNNAGMFDNEYSDSILLDTTAPTGTIIINGGAAATTSTNVTLTLSATDGQSGVAEMRFGNTGDPWSAWEPYGTSKPWILATGDGSKSVWVQFRNNAGGISAQYSDTIILDTTAPSPNPMTWSIEPYETSTTQISMTATTASDTTSPINYYFDSTTTPTGGGGRNDSSWQTGTSYSDSGLDINHQYGYRVYARDGLTNTTTPSSISYAYTDIETPSGITFGTVTGTSIQARSTNTPSGLTRGNSGVFVINNTAGYSSGWKQNNDYWQNNNLTPNTNYAFRAMAKNGDGKMTPYCASVDRRTLANPPGSSGFNNITQSSIQANWTANSNPAGTAYYCENTTAGTNSGWITATSWNSTGLNGGSSYSFRVKSRNESGIETGWISLGSQETLPLSSDLVVSGIVTDPVHPAPGDSVDIEVTIANQGLGDTGSFFTTRFYKHLSAPPIIGQASDVNWTNAGSLASGSSLILTHTVSYDTEGSFNMYVLVDSENDITENSEGNNVLGPQAIKVGGSVNIVPIFQLLLLK